MIRKRKVENIIIKHNVSVKLKAKIGRLLNDCMKLYNIKGKDKDMEEAFKTIFKSNLYYIINNHQNLNREKYKEELTQKIKKKYDKKITI